MSETVPVVCPYCGRRHFSKAYLNVICPCGAKFYANLKTWLNRNTGKEMVGGYVQKEEPHMTQRERLIELLFDAYCRGHLCDTCPAKDRCGDEFLETVADNLLANGVIVLPVSIGQTVYGFAHGKERLRSVQAEEVLGITFHTDECGWIETDDGEYRFGGTYGEIGKTIFLTREEAEEALEEGNT